MDKVTGTLVLARSKQSAFFPSNADISMPSPGTGYDWSGVSGGARFPDAGDPADSNSCGTRRSESGGWE
jgi:hypothetical protein